MQVSRILPWLLVAAVIALVAVTLRPRAAADMSTTAGAADTSVHAGSKHDSDAASTVIAATASAPITADSARRQPSGPPPEAPTHADMLAAVEANIRTLDAHFIAEPLDGAWAARTERSIDAFFDPARLTTASLAAPSNVNTRCHSSTCRITAYYSDPSMAEQTTQRLTMQLVDTLPYGAVMPRQLADGRVEVNAWYSSGALTP